MTNECDQTEIPTNEIAPLERRVVAVDPISGTRGDIEVIAVFRYGGTDSDQIDRHRFVFMYRYFDDDQTCSLGLSHWEPPSETVAAIDICLLRYVVAYFNQHGLSVSASIPLPEHQISDFDNDATLEIRPEASDERDADKPMQWVEEGSPAGDSEQDRFDP